MMGGNISESVQKEWPELAKEWASAEVNMPEETSKVSRVGPMGWVESHLPKIGDASGRSNFGRISINRQAVTEDNNLKETLQHELTHVGQKPKTLVEHLKSLFDRTPWEDRPEEKEAIAAELKFPRATKDIYLPSEYDKKRKR
jgi:hypothetical protein